MKKVAILALLAFAWPNLSGAQAETPLHFSGVGSFIWNELRLSEEKAEAFAKLAKKGNLSFVVIKAYDGKKWGVKHRKDFAPQLTREVVEAFHAHGILCYGYGTAYLYGRSDVGRHIKNAIQTLHLGADGLVIDDVFSYGRDRRQTERLFKGIWSHLEKCKKCQGKALAFSSFPFLDRRELPWQIPVRYTHFYLPQLYWVNLKQTPAEIFEKFQADWDKFRTRTKGVRSQIVPVAQTYDRSDERKVTPEDLSRFFSIARDAYPGVTFFRWKTTDGPKWEQVSWWAKNWSPPAETEESKEEEEPEAISLD